MNKCYIYLFTTLFIGLMASCSTTKYVPDGSYLLDDVKIETDNKEVKPSALSYYLRQHANAKWFSLFKTQLYIYNWSGRDSTKWVNRALRRMGDAPVIYSEEETQRTRDELRKTVQNMGYMQANVLTDTVIKKKKLKLTYRVQTGKPYSVNSLKWDVKDERIANILRSDSAQSLLAEGMNFNVNTLDQERQRITDYLHENGYYKFTKDYITYTADTVRNTHKVDLTLHLSPLKVFGTNETQPHKPYYFGKVNFITDYDLLKSSDLSSVEVNDSIHYKGYPIYFKDKMKLRPKVLLDNTFISPDSLYNESDVQRTFSSFARLQMLRYTNIRFFETQIGDTARLNTYIMLTRNKPQSVSLQLEGTNSAGDLGAAASVTYQHRNLFKGSELFMLKVRGAYEAISSLQSSYANDNYKEMGVEASINFPRFMFPFLSSDYRRKIRATTEFNIQYNSQLRPEFTRIVASAGWGYRWGNLQRQRSQHRIDLIDVNYLYMPKISQDFRDKYLNENNENYILRYNYEDRFIMRMGYSFTYNSAGQALANNTPISNSYTLRFNIESAGNLLYALGKLTNMPKNDNNEYTLLNIPFAQYVKSDIDLAGNMRIDSRNSIAFHIGLGIAIPYGNADLVPFEKRYFSGGANSVRGWSVRELGPGSFPGDGNFLNQSGDIKFDASVEYRTRLFWKFRGALFVDAGNIWTLRDYEDQPGGQFKLDTFYKQIAVAYGLGLRLDLDFFILRFDGGMKAINPSYEKGKSRFPIFHPKLRRDFAFHFAVGYPF